MKAFTNDDLIAYHLHELKPRRARALEQALQTDPALAAEFEAFAVTLREFKADTPLSMDEDILDRHWSLLRPSLLVHTAGSARRSWWRLSALTLGGLAFASTIWTVSVHHHAAPRAPSVSSNSKLETVPQRSSLSQEGLTADLPWSMRSGRTGKHGQMRRVSPPPRIDQEKASDRRISYLTLAAAPTPVPQYIQLAPASPLELPPAPPVLLTMEVPEAFGRSQGKRSRSKRSHPSAHLEHATDLTLSVGGTLIGTRQANNSGTEQRFQGATRAISALAAFHEQLRPLLGYRLTASYTRPEFQYTVRTSTSTGSTVSVNSRVYELAATYVVQGPHHGRLTTSAEAGAGFMGFLPTTASTETSYNLRGAAVVGVAAEVSLTKHVAMHVGYRGQAFKGPDFKYSAFTGPVATTTMFTNEPALGITYRFSQK